MLRRMPTRPIFLPGYGAPTSLYTGLLRDWRVPQAPSFASSRGSLDPYRRWALSELERSAVPVTLAGHSFGAALAILAAAERPELVRSLVLLGPAGLPLTKPMHRSLAAFSAQLALGSYPARAAREALGEVLRAPTQALRLARSIRRLDLRDACLRIRDAGLPAVVIGCTSDSLVTCSRSRRIADLLDAPHRQLDLTGGHMWMLRHGSRFSHELASATAWPGAPATRT
jgi:pimeloyl-ACP methyl ester carboxylesterase